VTIQVLHRDGVAPKIQAVFELEIYAPGLEPKFVGAIPAEWRLNTKIQLLGAWASPMLE